MYHQGNSQLGTGLTILPATGPGKRPSFPKTQPPCRGPLCWTREKGEALPAPLLWPHQELCWGWVAQPLSLLQEPHEAGPRECCKRRLWPTPGVDPSNVGVSLLVIHTLRILILQIHFAGLGFQTAESTINEITGHLKLTSWILK